MDNSAATPADSAADPAQPSADAGFRICIDCLPDGTFEVESEPLDESSDEEKGEESSEPASPPIKSFGEALQAALKMYQNGGDDGDAAFQSGLNSPDDDGTASIAPNPAMAAR